MSKKFIFSAVALMAFSFAGMANEIEEKKKIKIEDSPECTAAGRAAFEVVRDMGGDFDQCKAARIKVTSACEKAKSLTELNQSLVAE